MSPEAEPFPVAESMGSALYSLPAAGCATPPMTLPRTRDPIITVT